MGQSEAVLPRDKRMQPIDRAFPVFGKLIMRMNGHSSFVKLGHGVVSAEVARGNWLKSEDIGSAPLLWCILTNKGSAQALFVMRDLERAGGRRGVGAWYIRRAGGISIR